MLLSSAMSGSLLPCDSLQARHSQSALFFASPPTSPQNPQLSQPAFHGSLLSSCQSLQSIMSAQPSPFYDTNTELPPPDMNELPTPPLAHAMPPMPRTNFPGTITPGSKRLLVRSRARQGHLTATGDRGVTRKRIVKRATTPTPSPSKRRRAVEDDAEESSDELSAEPENEVASGLGIDWESSAPHNSLNHSSAFGPQPQWFENSQQEPEQIPEAPSTPKRSRIAPEQLPLGLDRSDFHDQYQLNPEQQGQGTNVEREGHDDMWSIEDDKILVELVLAKMKLKPEDWRDCAQTMGRDRHSLDRRWKTLMANNHVGVTRRRAKLHGTWR